MIVHIPHASSAIPADVRPQFLVDDESLKAELLRSTDWFTDELFSGLGEETIAYPVSRLVLDPERFEHDAKEPMAAVGRGAVYMNCTDGSPLRRAVSRSEREMLLERFYRPHHLKLHAATSREKARSGSALIIDAHSFPETAWSVEPRRWSERPDFCLGADDFHTPNDLVSGAEGMLRAAGFSTSINLPYSGTLIPSQYFRADARVFGIMIEVNRRLYMDESTGEKTQQFPAVCGIIRNLCALFAAWHGTVDTRHPTP